MAAVTRGDLTAVIPKAGNDEIGAMGRTLGLFRHSLREGERSGQEQQELAKHMVECAG